MNSYYVYLHRRLTDNKVFYVGKGCGRRAWNFNNRNRYWHNVKEKHGVVVDFVATNLDEKSALQLEMQTIKSLRELGEPLTNLSSGGESPIFQEESRKRMSESRKGRKVRPETLAKIISFHTGRKRSEETCRRISEALKGKPIPKERAMRSAANKSGTKSKISDKTVHCFINDSGEIFYGTRMELCEKYNLNKKLIAKIFGKNPRKSTMGWSLIEKSTNNPNLEEKDE